MKLRSIKYYLMEGLTGLIRNRLMTVASICTVAACIFIITFSYCIINNLQYILTQIEDSIGISVFLEDDVTAEEIANISERIKGLEYVSEVIYVSPAEALMELKEDWDVSDGILDGFDDNNNPLSDGFKVSLSSIKYQDEVLNGINAIEGVRNIRHAQTETELLMKANKYVTIFGILIIVILGAISVVIIMNTIKISVYTRRTEINIMKYVGATDWFIRWPFIVEGVLIGVIGAAIPIAIAWPSYGKIVNMIYSSFPVLENLVTFRFGIDIFSILFPVALCAGALLGVLGSVYSIRKHLKV